MRRLLQVAALTGALALAGCGVDDGTTVDEAGMDEGTAAEELGSSDDATDREPGVGEPAELNVAASDRIEIREGGSAWPTPGTPEAWEEADLVAELTDPAQVDTLVAALDDARHIDVGAVDYDLAPPDNQVGFFQGDELVERLRYYEDVSAWGEYEVNGRWVTEDWGLLAVTDELPTLN